MKNKSILNSPPGCIILILNLIGFIANIKDVVDFFFEIESRVPRQYFPPVNSWDLLWSGIILFYEMIAIALLILATISSKAIGPFKSMISSITLQSTGAILFVVSFYYKFYIPIDIKTTLIGGGLFVLLPLGVGYIILTLWLSADI